MLIFILLAVYILIGSWLSNGVAKYADDELRDFMYASRRNFKITRLVVTFFWLPLLLLSLVFLLAKKWSNA